MADIRPVKTLTKDIRKLTRASFERYGFAYGELLNQWAEIAGPELANVSAPERIRWPRGTAKDKMGGTLVIRVEPGHGLTIQHDKQRIIDRINGYYGYAAVADLKVMQGKLPADARKRTQPPPTEPDESRLEQLEAKLHEIGDDKLKGALRRLGKGALSKSRNPAGGEDNQG